MPLRHGSLSAARQIIPARGEEHGVEEGVALGRRDGDGNLSSDASELSVTVAQCHCFSGPQFLKLENDLNTKTCAK